MSIDRRLNPSLDPAPSRVRRIAAKVHAHWVWGRTQGWRRLIEEDQLNPVERLSVAARKAAWRARHGVPAGDSTAVFVVGLQRSGTNMLLRGLERSAAVEVHNENDKRVFELFRLREDSVVRAAIMRSHHTHVLFKPLCDSHRVAPLLGLAPAGQAFAVWAYRDVDGRTRSSLAKFGSHNLDVLRAIRAGTAGSMWQAQGLDDEARAVIAATDLDRLDPQSAASLFWWVRNRLFFTQGLDRDARVLLASYDAFVAAPETTMQAICARIGVAYSPALVAHVEVRGQGDRTALDIDPRIRSLCDELAARLESHRQGVERT